MVATAAAETDVTAAAEAYQVNTKLHITEDAVKAAIFPAPAIQHADAMKMPQIRTIVCLCPTVLPEHAATRVIRLLRI